ncbi:MAG: hypothetical protein ACKV22_36085 [Bryobacteraceae bacterium]
MPRNDDGEYELVLGNRQLLSGFFIVVVMFGVFFTMGYFVGRHSTPSNISAASTPPAATPASTSSTAPDAAMPASTTPPEPGRATLVTAEEVKKPVTTQPVTAPPAPPKPVAAETKAPPVAEPARKPEPKPAPVAAGGLQKVTPAAGEIFLQVSAPAVAAASSVVETLRKKGIKSVVAAGPDDATVRVLVGPLVPADIPAERAKLEGAGFKPFMRKY